MVWSEVMHERLKIAALILCREEYQFWLTSGSYHWTFGLERSGRKLIHAHFANWPLSRLEQLHDAWEIADSMTIDVSVLINKKIDIMLATIRMSSGLPRSSVLILRWNGTTTNAYFTKGNYGPRLYINQHDTNLGKGVSCQIPHQTSFVLLTWTLRILFFSNRSPPYFSSSLSGTLDIFKPCARAIKGGKKCSVNVLRVHWPSDQPSCHWLKGHPHGKCVCKFPIIWCIVLVTDLDRNFFPKRTT